MNVAHILARKGREVVCVAPDQTLQEVAVIMSDKGIGAVVVCNRDDAIVGILSERDIMRRIARSGAQALNERAENHMTANVVTCGENTTIQVLMERMTKGRFRHMPVVVDGKLSGMVSIGDLIKNRIVEVEEEQEALKNYIATA